MKKFKVYSEWKAYGFRIIRAKTPREAMVKMYKHPLPPPKNEYNNADYLVTHAEEIPIKGRKFRKIP